MSFQHFIRQTMQHVPHDQHSFLNRICLSAIKLIFCVCFLYTLILLAVLSIKHENVGSN